MRNRGFTLIELMIVVAIIAIIMSIAIPSLSGARKSANETRAIATLRTIGTAQEQYKTRFGHYAADIGNLEDTGYLDIEFEAYDIVAYSAAQHVWAMSVRPATDADGDRYFYTDARGVIRFNTTGPATATDDPVD